MSTATKIIGDRDLRHGCDAEAGQRRRTRGRAARADRRARDAARSERAGPSDHGAATSVASVALTGAALGIAVQGRRVRRSPKLIIAYLAPPSTCSIACSTGVSKFFSI